MNQDWEDLLDRELPKAERLVILGVGNKGKGDDAVGNLCVEMLKKRLGPDDRPDLMILDGGPMPENETGRVREFGPTDVLIIDAGLAGREPGAIFVVEPAEIQVEDLATHHLPLSLLVRYFEASLGCRVHCLGIEPKGMEWGIHISPPVRRAAQMIVDKLVGILESKRSARS